MNDQETKIDEMKVEVKPVEFGGMTIVDLLEGRYTNRVELMRFDRSGSWHKHAHDEIAVCVYGRGQVHFDTDDGMVTREVEAGHILRIEAGREHFMQPKGPGLTFAILYVDKATRADELSSTLKRLRRIAQIIEHVDTRCMAADGPVTATLDEMTQAEISEVYALAGGVPEKDEVTS